MGSMHMELSSISSKLWNRISDFNMLMFSHCSPMWRSSHILGSGPHTLKLSLLMFWVKKYLIFSTILTILKLRINIYTSNFLMPRHLISNIYGSKWKPHSFTCVLNRPLYSLYFPQRNVFHRNAYSCHGRTELMSWPCHGQNP